MLIEKNVIKEGLKNGDKRFSDNLFCIINLEDENEWHKAFKEDYEKCYEKCKTEEDEELPF